MSLNMEDVILAATRRVEDSLDAEIEKLDRMEDEDLQALERKRYDQLKKQLKIKEGLVASGHGVYTECFSERDFFDLGRKSKNIICHFYRPSTMRCGIVDKHLTALAPKHIEAKFIKINAEKSPFLVERLKVKVLPTIVVCKEEKFVDYIVGFDDLGGTDDFTTDMMAQRLARSGVINYKGEPKKANPFLRVKPKTIRGGGYDDSDSD